MIVMNYGISVYADCGRIMAIMTFLLIPVCAVHTVWNQKRGSNLIEVIELLSFPAVINSAFVIMQKLT